MVHERWLHAVTRHTGCEMGVDGELEGGGNEGAQACSQDLPPPRGPGPGIAAHKEPPRLSQALRDLEAHPR